MSSSTVTPNGTSEAHFVSRYSISGATCSVNNQVSGVKVPPAAPWQGQDFSRGPVTGTSPNGVRNWNEVRPLLQRRLPHASQSLDGATPTKARAERIAAFQRDLLSTLAATARKADLAPRHYRVPPPGEMPPKAPSVRPLPIAAAVVTGLARQTLSASPRGPPRFSPVRALGLTTVWHRGKRPRGIERPRGSRD